MTPGLLPGASAHSRHATPSAPDHSGPPTSPTSLNVTAGEQPRREAGTTHLPGIAGTGGIRFTIGVMVDSAEEVDQLTEQMRAAGARVTKQPVDAEFFTGRSAYLCDPEGNYFEIAWADMPNNPVVMATRRAAGA